MNVRTDRQTEFTYFTYIGARSGSPQSAGPDNIPNFVLKLCSSVIAPILQVISTQNLQIQTLPSDWLL